MMMTRQRVFVFMYYTTSTIMSNDRLPQLSKKVGSVRNLISNFESSNQQNHSMKDQELNGVEQENINDKNLSTLFGVTTSDNNQHELDSLAEKCYTDVTKVDESCVEHLSVKGSDEKQIEEACTQSELKVNVSISNTPERNLSLKQTNEGKTSDDILYSGLVSNLVEQNIDEISQVEKYHEQDISSSVYSCQEKKNENETESPKIEIPENPNNIISCKMTPNLDLSGIETSNSKEPSDWDSGNFLKQFGIESQTHASLGSDKLDNSIIISAKESNNCFVDRFASTDSDKTKDSTLKSFVDLSWHLGDIDGLEKISTKSKQAGSPENENDNNPNHEVTRKRSVSFNEEKNDVYYLDPKASDKDLEDNNPWKYVCYGIIIATLFFYIITITFKEFFTQQNPTILITEADVLGFFNGTSNHTRDYILKQLMETYDLLPPETLLPHSNTTKRITYSPRNDDEKIISVYNSFESINPEYHKDHEIQQLMENDNLKFMFAGMAYAPENVIEPECGASYREVLLDIARLSTITGKLKTYGTQCNQAEYILKAIADLRLNMTLALGVWICEDEIVNQNQLTEMKRLLKEHPPYLIDSIFIGNEVLYREDRSVDELLSYVRDTQKFLRDLNISHIPVGTSELGSKITPELIHACDIVGANIHPFFGGVEAQFGARWVMDYYHTTLLPQFPNNETQKLFISEIGWPYKGGEFNKAVAGSWEFQQFLNDWLCTTPAEILNNCYYFEAYDESWKSIWWEGNHTWETEWGFFDNQRKMKKHIYMPDCSKYGNPAMTDLTYLGNVGNY